jgi:sulfate transport system ATP-binding protein
MLLLDEPFGALDAKVRKDLRRWLRGLHERLGITTIFVTHEQEEAFALADLVAVINKGKVEQYGLPEDIRRSPRTAFVAEFLDSGDGRLGSAFAKPSRSHDSHHGLSASGGKRDSQERA